jgi:PAS domain S-box-containing protein
MGLDRRYALDISPDDKSVVGDWNSAVSKSGKPCRAEIWMLHKRPQDDIASRLKYWRTAIEAPQIENQDRLQGPSAEEFRLIAENIPMLCWIARGDGYIYWYNRRWHDYCGSTPKAMEGWGWQDVHDPEQLPEVMESWTSSINTGEPFEMVFPLRGADGIFRRFLTRIVPVKGRDGEIVRWLGINAEVETHLNAETALALSEAKFRVLTDAMPQMVWSTLPDGFHDYYNARWYEFTGVAQGSTDGEGWSDMFHPDDQERARQRWERSLITGEDYEVEYRLKHRSGEYRWTLGRALPVKGSQGEIIRWIGTCTDIHESKLASDQTELMSRELSHRIKNIFAVIAGLIGLSAPADERTRGFAKQLAGRISALGRAHNFARPHSEMSDPGHDFGTLHGLLREILQPYEINGNARYRVGGDDVPVGERSATPIALVIHELATNAVKYGALSSATGRIAISTTREADDVVIEWREEGGPTVPEIPGQAGFGAQLSEISITDQLGGAIERHWHPEGLKVIMRVRADRL